MDQCMAEQVYVRGAMMRTLLYNQVSISGQALVFVVRTQDYSLLARAGTLTYVAFVLAQVCFGLVMAMYDEWRSVGLTTVQQPQLTKT